MANKQASKEKFFGTMQAWQAPTAQGGLEKNLKLNKSALRPDTTNLSKDQVLIQVTHMSPNPVDYKVPELGALSKLMVTYPAIPGGDFAGKVVQTHASNDSVKVGQMVFGTLGTPSGKGSMAQFTVANLKGLAVLPEGVEAEHAAAVGVTGLTAYQCVVPHVQDKPYVPKVFINGGSGGTGTWGIQFAKVFGAEVTTSCSSPNVELCKSLGANEVIDYKTQDVVQTLKSHGQVYDLIVVNVGYTTGLYEQSEHYLKPSGKYVQVGGGMDMKSIKATATRMLKPSFLGGGKRPYQFLGMSPDSQQLETIAGWMRDGKVKAVVEKRFEWSEGAKAYETLKTGRTRGNIVVRVEEGSS